ncbi:hypothetical protein ACFL6I_15215 [candidate division KSB1 bacterium]
MSVFKNNKLWAELIPDSYEGVERTPDKINASRFRAVTEHGENWSFEFTKDEKGKVIKCKFTDEDFGLEVAGDRIQKDKKTDKTKLYSELAGSYEFDVSGRFVPFWLIVKNGKLFLDIKVAGADTEEMIPVEGEEMKFETIANGYEVIAAFKRNDEGKIKGCTLCYPGMGADYETVS